ncbi:MAG: AAA family ATPase [Deltaproteobacteria bacterium]|nr:AAA family ATPase [Deltaproteobacteria bacterium]
MKILRLDLIACGPFTDTAIDLAAGTEGLHIVYGPNEAGKSSALRALRHLLYGIPERTPDAFRHPFSKMRIGAVLKSARGEALEVVRRKGRGSTLRHADDKTAIEETELQHFLNGVDADLFATMFGIGYEDLVRGGREIIQGGGDLGRLIFAAGSGASNLGVVLDELQTDADTLFRPTGQKQKINEAVGRLKQHRSVLKESQLPGQEWARHDRALKTAQAQKTGVEEKLGIAQRKLNRLQRIAEAHPVMARRREILKGLEAVAGAALLPEGFANRRTEALTRLRVSESERDQALAALSNLRMSVAGLEDPAMLLDQAEGIEELHQELGSQRKAAKDRIALETRRNTLRTEARQILRSLREDLTIEEAERLRVRKPEAVRIQELGAEYERIATRIESGREKIPEYTRQIAGVEARLSALAKPRPVDALKAALALGEEALPLEQQLKSVCTEKQALRQACEQSRARLGLSATSLEELGRLQAPAVETIRIFEDRFDSLERRLSTLAEETRKTAVSLSETGHRLEEVRLEREVPTEADLEAARKLRGRGWGLIARRLESEAVSADEQQLFVRSFPGAASLSAAFAASIDKSDALADRLRREADRVAVKARLLADQAAFTEQVKQLGEELAAGRAEKAAAAAEWAGVWRPLSATPRSPREMRQWLQDFRTLVEKASEALKRSVQCEALQAEVDGAGSELGRCLEAMAEPSAVEAETLSGRVKRVRSIVAAEEQLGRQREELVREKTRFENELESASSRLQANEGELRRWQKDWEQAVKPLGLAADVRPGAANAVMEELKSLFDKLREAEVLQQRLDGIERDAEAFMRRVKALASAVAADLAARPADEAALELQRRLTGARQTQSKRQTLQKQSDQAQVKMQQAAVAMAEIAAQLKGMCMEAGCRLSDDLPEAERRSAQRLQLEARLRHENERLLQLGGGTAVDEFVSEVAAIDPDGIAGDIERLKEQIQQISAEKSELDQAIGRENAELSRMDGGDRAAVIAEEMQSILGGLERDVQQYARLKIATRVLNLAIERFRQKSQGPILKRASNRFSRITCGSFEDVRADHDPDGNPVLVGVRPGGKEIVPVEGMSDGTADQLFLALRLAGLEHYLDENEPMPFIVDDILIKFDNSRAAAALQALAEISAKTQVIFFTHHRHLVELAVTRIDEAVLFVHGLG